MASATPPPGSHHSNPTESYFDNQFQPQQQLNPFPSSTTHPSNCPPGQFPSSILSPQAGLIGLQPANTEVIPVVNGGIVTPSQQISHSGFTPSQAHPHPYTYSHSYPHSNLQVYPHTGGGLIPIPANQLHGCSNQLNQFVIPNPATSGTVVFHGHKGHQGQPTGAVFPTSPPPPSGVNPVIGGGIPPSGSNQS